MKTYKQYINEGIRDKMTPKSEEDIIKALKGLEPYQQMYKAIRYGLLSIVKELISGGIDLEKNIGGGTPAGYSFINEAIEYGKLDILKYLLDNGCDMRDMQDIQLDEAIRGEHYDVARFLVDEYNASVNDQEGDLYLQMAVESNSLDLVKLVIEQNCLEFGDEDWLNDILLSNNINPEIIKYLMDNITEVKEFFEKMYNNYKKAVDILEKYVK